MRRTLSVAVLIGTLCAFALSACTTPHHLLDRRDRALDEQARYEALAFRPDSVLTDAERNERDYLGARQFERARQLETFERDMEKHNAMVVIGFTSAFAALTSIVSYIVWAP